ncbi:hypothetical protein C8J56DRAFT_1158115 [Mycena floridula]|nr:hypothetical protein C8J56DRAFT_1158115 [Mycena floridula]
MSDFIVVDTDHNTMAQAVVDGIKGLANELQAAQQEQRFHCVQCDQEFRNSTNSPTACSYHPAEYSTWDRKYPCCGSSNIPCQVNTHRRYHHCDYPYSAFFQRAYSITGYTDTTDPWLSIEDTDLDTDKISKASISQILRWQSRGDLIREPTILIRVGTILYTEPYFFQTFTSEQLQAVAKTVCLTKATTIFQTSTSDSQFVMAEWVLSADGSTITAVRLTVKAATSDMPFNCVCPIDISSCTKAGEIQIVSEGGLRPLQNRTPYILPDTLRVGPELSDKPLRACRTDFKTKTSQSLPLILKITSDPPLNPNPRDSCNLTSATDFFAGTISVFNKHPAGSLNPITIDSITAQFRLVGEDSYLPVKSIKISRASEMPFTLEPRQSWSFSFVAEVPRTENDANLDVIWWNKSFINRASPLRLKLIVRDIEEEEASLVIEHIHEPRSLEAPASDDLAFVYFDDPELWKRCYIHVDKRTDEDEVIRINRNTFQAHRLHKLVHRALKTGETEIDLKIGEKEHGWEWQAFALVDISCQRVYAFKLLLKSRKFGCLSYVACPTYGNVIEQDKDIRYANEKVQMPDLLPYDAKKVVVDDDVDDFVQATSKPTSVSSPTSTTSAAIPPELLQRLASIDESSSRIATAMEQLVELFTKRHDHTMSYMG